MNTVQHELESTGVQTPKATWMMILRLACNIFAHPVLVTTYFTSHLASSHRGILTQLLITSLLAHDTQVRQTAASLAFNCSTRVMAERLQNEQDNGDAQEDDDWQVEIVSAVVDALSKETDPDITHKLLACISKLLFLAPANSSLPDLLSVLDVCGTIDGKKKDAIISSTPVVELARDIHLMIDKSLSDKL
jgi:hypothetical protein